MNKPNILLRKKQYWVIFAYMVFYFWAFVSLENRTNVSYHILHAKFDDLIPFLEGFVIPYYMWFIYMILVLFFFSLGRTSAWEFHQLLFVLGIGMTIFLFVSYVYPNGLDLRPAAFPRDNLFSRLVADLYTRDTSTNVLPSIHVFNSVAVCIALWTCERFKKANVVKALSLIVTILIVLSTMFIKQHSVVDVTLALLMNLVLYLIFYAPRWARRNLENSQQAQGLFAWIRERIKSKDQTKSY